MNKSTLYNRKLPYGESNFKRIIGENSYYIDRTQYIETIENSDAKYVFLLRPRRFGKSLFVSMLEYYYGLQYKEEFNQLFGQLYIGKNPTPGANAYLILSFEFSRIDTQSFESTKQGFLSNVKNGIRTFFSNYDHIFDIEDKTKVIDKQTVEDCLKELFTLYTEKKITTPVFILIDEYDHFANELIAFNFNEFKSIVSENGFVRKFYESIKAATNTQIVGRFFATGVTPITLDSLTSGFNIAKNFSTRQNLNQAMGFTEDEVKNLLEEVAKDRNFLLQIDQIMPDLRKWYNGYLFHEDAAERIYNPDMILHFILEYSQHQFKKYPKEIVDTNVLSDYGKIQKLFQFKDKLRNYQLIERLIKQEEVKSELTQVFNIEIRFTDDDFISLLFYMGYISIIGNDLNSIKFHIPNFVIKSVFYDYFAEIIRKESELELDIPDIREIVKQLAQENKISPFIELIERTLKALSNRDMIHFDEKYIHLLFVAFANQAGFYYVKSQPEIEKKYPDVMFLYRPPFYPKFQFIFELKYLKKEDASKLEAKRKKATEQIKSYMQSKEMLDFIVRPEAGMETVKAYIAIFVGDKAEIVDEIEIQEIE